MTERQIRIFGDPVLKTVSDLIRPTDDVTGLIEDLIDTVKIPGRAGVAAPQIGVNQRAFSYNVDGQVGYIINPVVVEVSGEPDAPVTTETRENVGACGPSTVTGSPAAAPGTRTI